MDSPFRRQATIRRDAEASTDVARRRPPFLARGGRSWWRRRRPGCAGRTAARPSRAAARRRPRRRRGARRRARSSSVVRASGLSKPVFVTSARDGTGRLFIVEQTGQDQDLQERRGPGRRPFLSITSSVSNGYEQGLLGLAFHPELQDQPQALRQLHRQRRRHRHPRVPSIELEPERRRHEHARGRSSRSPSRTTTTTAACSPSGRTATCTSARATAAIGGDPGQRAQNVNSLLGKMLRIDINGTTSTTNYRIPRSNPYVGITGATRSGRSGSATRGASRSTAPTATCGSATSARTSGRRSTARSRTSTGRRPQGQLGLGRARGLPLLRAVERLQHVGPDRARRRVRPRRRALLGDRRLRLSRHGASRRWSAATSSPTTAAARSG